MGRLPHCCARQLVHIHGRSGGRSAGELGKPWCRKLCPDNPGEHIDAVVRPTSTPRQTPYDAKHILSTSSRHDCGGRHGSQSHLQHKEILDDDRQERGFGQLLECARDDECIHEGAASQ